MEDVDDLKKWGVPPFYSRTLAVDGSGDGGFHHLPSPSSCFLQLFLKMQLRSSKSITQIQHIRVVFLADKPQSIADKPHRPHSEMLDGCRALLSVATLTTPMVFDKLLKSSSTFGTLSLLSALTCEVVKARLASNTDEETWSWVARDILLDTWTALLEPIGANKDTTLPPEGATATATVFKLIVESELKTAAAHAFDDEDVFDYLRASISAMDERLSSYALIARAAVEVTIPSLTRLFSERFALLHQALFEYFLANSLFHGYTYNSYHHFLYFMCASKLDS